MIVDEVRPLASGMTNENNISTWMIQADWRPAEKLEINTNLAYSLAASTMSGVQFPNDLHIDGDRLDSLSSWEGTYDPANINNMETYSNLDYTIIDFTLAARYAFSDSLSFSIKYLFSDVTDDSPYVYGDQDSTYHTVLSSLNWKF